MSKYCDSKNGCSRLVIVLLIKGKRASLGELSLEKLVAACFVNWKLESYLWQHDEAKRQDEENHIYSIHPSHEDEV